MSIEEIEKEKDKTAKYNVKMVCKDLAARVDGAPGPQGTLLKGLVAEDTGDQLLNDKKYLDLFMNSSKTSKTNVPGYHYYSSLESFFDGHFRRGDKFREYLKGNCKSTGGPPCRYCQYNPQVVGDLAFIPQPMPDARRLPEYHYLSLAETPTADRESDDFQPRKQINDAVRNGTLKIDDEIILQQFCDKIIVKKKYVLEYARKCVYREIMQKKRSNLKRTEKESEDRKSYHAFDWEHLYTSGHVEKLRVPILNKYIIHHKLDNKCLSLKKKEKARLI